MKDSLRALATCVTAIVFACFVTVVAPLLLAVCCIVVVVGIWCIAAATLLNEFKKIFKRKDDSISNIH